MTSSSLGTGRYDPLGRGQSQHRKTVFTYPSKDGRGNVTTNDPWKKTKSRGFRSALFSYSPGERAAYDQTCHVHAVTCGMAALHEHPTPVTSTHQSRWLGEPASEVTGSLADVAPLIPAFDRFPFGTNARLDMIVRRATAKGEIRCPPAWSRNDMCSFSTPPSFRPWRTRCARQTSAARPPVPPDTERIGCAHGDTRRTARAVCVQRSRRTLDGAHVRVLQLGRPNGPALRAPRMVPLCLQQRPRRRHDARVIASPPPAAASDRRARTRAHRGAGCRGMRPRTADRVHGLVRVGQRAADLGGWSGCERMGRIRGGTRARDRDHGA